eukprot:TRINITY_DN14208_c0_g1_i1.p1 TRINITY_DN14208_c0_g1~~TRINITY_DN14208_c0_g1_i1.p1  ORF type:complete len:137 (-),score=23.32 TRINITY_DN14208_c0_g1_i1:83-493(-)
MLSQIRTAGKTATLMAPKSKTLLTHSKSPILPTGERTIVFQWAEQAMKKYLPFGDKMDYKVDRHNDLKIRYDYRKGPMDDLDNQDAWHFGNYKPGDALPLPADPTWGAVVITVAASIGISIPFIASYWQMHKDEGK